MSDILLVRDRQPTRSLAEVSRQIFSLLNLSVFEERESSHYVDGCYFVAHAANVAVKVYLADDEQMSDYRFAVVLTNQALRRDISHSIDAGSDPVASKLAMAGFDVFVTPALWGHVDCKQQGIHYEADTEKPKNA